MDWRSLPHWLEISAALLAQTPSPELSPSPTPADVELLKNQLEFLRQSYSQFADTVRIIFTILGIAGALVAFFFGRSFKEFQDFARKDIENLRSFAQKDIKDLQDFSRQQVTAAVLQVQQETEAQIPRLVELEVARLVREEVENLERTLRREQVIGRTLVDYYLPAGTTQPGEVKLLQARNFRKIRFRTDLHSIERSPGDVVILDLKNWTLPSGQKFNDLPEAEQQPVGKQLVQDLLDVLPESVVIVVYIRGRLFYLNDIADRYVIAANNPVTLVGNVADGAYVAYGIAPSPYSP